MTLRRTLASTDMRWGAALTGFALLMRLGFVVAVERESFVFNDTLFYHNAAEKLSNGQGLRAAAGGPTAQWPPAYPFLVSLVYRVTGAEPLAGEILNAVLGALTVTLLFLLARRLFGRRTAIFAAAGLAVLPGPILWSDVLLSETVYAFVLVAIFGLVAVLPRRPWAVMVLGFAIGLAILIRGEGILLIPALLAVWWPELSLRPWLARAVALIAVVALTITPWTIRNAIVMDAFIPLSTNASITLWSGHNPNATGAQNYAPPSLGAQLPAFGPTREVEEANLLRREALEYLVSHPGDELQLIPLKLANLARGDSYALDWVNVERGGSPGPIGGPLLAPIRVLADASFYALLATTLASVALLWRELWRNRVTRGVLALFAVSLVMFGFVYYGNYRYRAPLEPLMLLLAGLLVARLAALRRELAPPDATLAASQ